MKIIKAFLPLLMVGIFTVQSLSAQRTENFKSPQYEYQTAVDLFNKEKYGSAQQYFKYVYESTDDKQHDLKTNSLFYQGVCAAKLDNQDAAKVVSQITGDELVRFFDRNVETLKNIPEKEAVA